MTECVFCRIASGELPAVILHEDDMVIAFMDSGPIRPGHTQILSREHFPYFEDMPPDVAARVLETGQRLARAMKETYGVARVAFLFTGGDVAHAHAHVVPMREKTDITSPRYFTGETLAASLEEREIEAARLRPFLAGG